LLNLYFNEIFAISLLDISENYRKVIPMKKVEQRTPTQTKYTETEHDCPVCGMKMFTEVQGESTVIWCGYNIPQPDHCHCREVVAYGKNLKEAYATLKDKFSRALESRKKNQ
jgi:hypothetical protein